MPSTKPYLTEEEYARPAAITIKHYGLDQPLSVQYVKWMRSLLEGVRARVVAVRSSGIQRVACS